MPEDESGPSAYGGDPNPPPDGQPAPPPWPPPQPAPAAPAPGPAPEWGAPSPPAQPVPVDIELPGRAKQRRWTVLIRGILAIPIAVVTIIVAIGTFFCAIVGWFAALFTGRAPQFLRTIVSLLLLLNLRLQAYSLLMTDRFPPLGFGDEPDYRVAVAAPPATKLNRWAVAFRIILVIPANIVVTLATYGIALLSIAGWVNALVTGWLPRTFHDAYRAFLRYQTRTNAYLYLLVPTYPEALFGEEPAPVIPAGPPPEPAPTPAPPFAEEQPAPVIPSYPAPETAPEPSRWRVVLDAGARRVLVIALILGVPVAIGIGVVRATAFNSAITSLDRQPLVQANNQLVETFRQFDTTARACTTVSCLEQADAMLSQQLGDFVRSVQSAGDRGVDAAVVAQTISAAQNAQSATEAMTGGGSTLSEYQSLAARVQLVQRLQALAQAQQQFAAAVNS